MDIPSLVDALFAPPPGLPADLLPPAGFDPEGRENEYVWWPPYPSTLTDADLAEAEALLATTFSPQYRELLRHAHGCFVSGGLDWQFPRSSWLDSTRDMASLSGDGAHFAGLFQQGLVPLTSLPDHGEYCFAGPYRGTEPAIVGWDHERPFQHFTWRIP